MKKRILLLLAIFIFIVAIGFSIIGIWEENNTARIIGLILIAICSLINVVRGFTRWNEGK